ncbi:MAG: transporter [Deltaproteobacteria bacterium HGW-Deltaproteobacteria-10]|nr:MAG: transporter [Deltaproteobacteria bacterium HGW-Deltaproteobacteria-10]
MGNIYKVIEIIGSSKKSWEDAASNAVETAAESLEDIRVAEVKELDIRVDKGKVVEYRAKLSLSFKYDKKRVLDDRSSLLAGRKLL